MIDASIANGVPKHAQTHARSRDAPDQGMLGGFADACCDVNGDDIVDVNDLLAVIVSWGPCQRSCPADVVPFPEGDGVVDVNDLLAVIVNWD